MDDRQSEGGKKRARKLSPERRREIAKEGADVRWGRDLPKAPYTGEIHLGGEDSGIVIACAVLPNGKRLLTQGTFLKAIGRSRTPKAGTGGLSTVDGLPTFLQAETLKPFITDELRASTTPLFFRDNTGKRSVGYEAELLPMVAEVYLTYRDSLLKDGKPIPSQYERILTQCDIVMRGLARVGIIALIDEATGYQYARPRRDLEEYLKRFLSESLRRWVRTFPADYFKHLCRLRGVELRADMKLPQYFGVLTNNLVYRRIAPGLLKSLKDRRCERGRPSNKLHSWASLDTGVPEILLHLGTVVGLMKLHKNYADFEKQLDQIAPIYPETPGLFDDPADWDERSPNAGLPPPASDK